MNVMDLINSLIGSGGRAGEDQRALNVKLRMAAVTCSGSSIASLLREGAQIDPPECGGQTALLTLARKARVDLCSYLVERGADIHARRHDGKTALHLAAASGSLEMARFLIASGAEPQGRDQRGATAYDIAAKAANDEIKGSVVTPFARARWARRVALAELLFEAQERQKAEAAERPS